MTEINIRVTTTPPATIEVLNPEGPQGEQGPQGPQGVPGTPGLDAANSPYNVGLAGSIARTVDARLSDIVSVKDFGATGDGSTNDTAAVQAALDASLGVYFPAGVYSCGTLALQSGHVLQGAGDLVARIVSRSGTNGDGFTGAAVAGVRVSGLTIDGNSAGNTTGFGFNFSGASSDIRITACTLTDWAVSGFLAGTGVTDATIENCVLSENTDDGAAFTAVTRPAVLNSTLINNGRFGAVFGAGCVSPRLVGNVIAGNSATQATGAGALAISCTDAAFTGNTVYGNTLGHGLQFNTVTRGTMSGNTSRNNGISGLDSFASQFVTFTGNTSFDNDVRGIEIDSAAYYNTCVGNVVYRNGGAGISVYRSPGTLIEGNVSTENGSGLPVGLGLPAEPYGIRLWDDLNTLQSSNCRVIGNICTDDRGGSATQTHGISIEAAGTTGTVVIGNNLSPNVTAGINFTDGQVLRARDNTGFVTQGEGVGTMAAGATTLVINHGLTAPLNSKVNINLTLLNQPSTDIVNHWVTAIGDTSFTVNFGVAPGGTGVNFLWRVSAY